ncbi:MAG TPA: tRNA pseudouridine(38-40) synthase TruA [Vicinamibacterales bacterium]|nr:tRNA pseudouridine(38-40) synthase TruA [Vicinamibacterales bacterium]
MARFKLTIEYAGTRYSGWQIQKNARTVQGELAHAIQQAAGRREFELYGAGRTDAGVHALAQVAHLDVYTSLEAHTLCARINERLPADIHVNDAAPVPHRFHARHDARSRSYLYQVSRRKSAFFKPYVWWVKEELDADAMRAAASAFVGLKPFDSFTADEPDEKSTKVLIERVEIAEEGALVLIRVIGSHFLWRMVRRMAGVLAGVGRGELEIRDVAGLFGSKSAVPAALTAPASGLFLEGVYYRPGDGPGPLHGPLRVPLAG